MNAIKSVSDLYQILNVPVITNLIDGKVWQYSRPINSELTDIVVHAVSYVRGGLDIVTLEVNIFTPNTETPDNTFPNMPILRAVTDAVLPLLSGFDITDSAVPTKDADGNWYINIKIIGERIGELSVNVELLSETSTDDGYGGFTVALNSVWTGKASQVNLQTGSQLNVNVGRHEFNMRSEWIVPNDAPVSRSTQLKHNGDIYVINGIRPFGLFRILSTVRKDG